MLLGLMFAAYSGESSLFRRSFALHGLIANVLSFVLPLTLVPPFTTPFLVHFYRL